MAQVFLPPRLQKGPSLVLSHAGSQVPWSSRAICLHVHVVSSSPYLCMSFTNPLVGFRAHLDNPR
jgi:hypothetical protein